jgi:hypothetical protein
VTANYQRSHGRQSGGTSRRLRLTPQSQTGNKCSQGLNGRPGGVSIPSSRSQHVHQEITRSEKDVARLRAQQMLDDAREAVRPDVKAMIENCHQVDQAAAAMAGDPITPANEGFWQIAGKQVIYQWVMLEWVICPLNPRDCYESDA